MNTFTFNKPHNLRQLNDELLSAIPALAPTPDTVVEPDLPNAMRAVFRCEGRESDGFIRVTVPDGVPQAELDAVIAAHVADPDYGVEPEVTTDDLMNMTNRDLRTWLARRLL